MKKTMMKAGLLAGLLAGGMTAATAQAPDAEMLAFTCLGCHGPGGQSVGPATPTIAGMPRGAFILAMEGYRDGDLPGTVMDRHGGGYTPEEIRKMADFFAEQPYRPAKQDYDAALAARGAEVHEAHCAGCHENNGAAFEDDLPRIAGQWIPYLEYTMIDYFRYGRPIPRGKGGRLRDFAEERNREQMAEDIRALAHFYGSQQDPALYK